VVDNLDALDTTLTPLLIDLGKVHAQSLVLNMEAFDMFQAAMLKIWEEELDNKFTTEVRDTWNIVFSFIMQKIKDGYQMDRQVTKVELTT
jgi:hemoglobin-like flavoprotein